MNRLGAMTASIAHEINQPLAAIAANTSAALRWLAKTTPNLDEARAALEGIGRDTQRAADVVEGIRAMFKSDSHNRVLLDINQLVREVLVLVQSELFKRGISLDTELTENLPQVMADRVQLQQVVMNLVTNAMDAMEPIADRQKLLRVKSSIGDGDIVVVAIEDTGTGIDADKVDRVFDAFFTTNTKPRRPICPLSEPDDGTAIVLKWLKDFGMSLAALGPHNESPSFSISLMEWGWVYRFADR